MKGDGSVKECLRWWGAAAGCLMGLAVVVCAALALSDLDQPYRDTAHYQRMAEKHNGFIGMRAEEVVPLVTKHRNYLVLDPHTADNGGDEGIFCFPLTNSKSREECLIYGFRLDENHVILERLEHFAWTPENFFGTLEWHRANVSD